MTELVVEERTHRTTVNSVLKLDIFRQSGAFVAAGSTGLTRPVRWVHAGEISDIAQFLSGGELLLTAGQGIGSTAGEQRRYVRSIAEVGVAALVVELSGRAFSEFPAAVVEEAELLGLPLIGLREEVPFVAVSARVLEELTDSAHREFARSVEVNRLLADRLIAGADHITLVRYLSQNLDRALILESAAHEIQAAYGETKQSARLISDWPAHSRSMESHQDGPQRTCTRVPVVAQGGTWGWLHMPAVKAENHVDQVVLEQGASAIAISLLNERVSGARSGHHQGVLINRLMLGDVSGEGFIDRASRLGKDLRGMQLLVTIVGNDGEPTADVERFVRDALASGHLPAVTADIGDAVLSVIGLQSERSMTLAVRALVSDERVMGLSKVVGIDGLPGAIQQAKAAFAAGLPCQHFDKLGLLRLLVPLAASAELAAYVEDELGPILAHDSARNSSLFETLDAFLKCDGNKADAARTLFTQRRTVYYRLEKVGQILGLSLDDTDVRLRLQVAIQGLELLKKTRSVRGLQGLN